MIHQEAKVYAVADKHQAVEAVVTVALFIWIHSILNHILICICATQLLEDILVRVREHPTCVSEDKQVAMMAVSVPINLYFVLDILFTIVN